MSKYLSIEIKIILLINAMFCLTYFYNRKLSTINFNNVFSFVINISSNFQFCWLVLKAYCSHWFGVRQIGDNYYNLDSKLKHPQQVQNILNFLKPYSVDPNCHIFLVVSEDVEKEKSWLIEDNNESNNSDHLMYPCIVK